MSASSEADDWRPGDTIRVRTGSDENHLFVVITPPDPKSGAFLIVPLNTLRPHTLDKSCILDPEEHSHPFLKAKSVVRYDLIREATPQALARAEAARLADIRPYKPFAAKTVRYIQECALRSEHIDERHETRILASLNAHG